MSGYIVSATEKPDANELLHLFEQTSWADQRDEARVGRMLEGLEVFVAVRANGKLVAFGRAVTDGLFRALIDDMIVDQEHRAEVSDRR